VAGDGGTLKTVRHGFSRFFGDQNALDAIRNVAFQRSEAARCLRLMTFLRSKANFGFAPFLS